ncbi:hypothetical protein OTU49_004146 [Cherax quadricarinatus]|uniref:Uncharacterized protein n=1 Tax=Cherax quadricarinatus TaxID=27406 RepID=A0AAW0XF52_CHEQU
MTSLIESVGEEPLAAPEVGMLTWGFVMRFVVLSVLAWKLYRGYFQKAAAKKNGYKDSNGKCIKKYQIGIRKDVLESHDSVHPVVLEPVVIARRKFLEPDVGVHTESLEPDVSERSEMDLEPQVSVKTELDKNLQVRKY